MDTTVPHDVFDNAYADGLPGWVVGEPQPAVVALEREGLIGGAVLDAGCGTGEHTIHLAERGYDVRGIDFSERAVALARRNAAERGVLPRFEVADALAIDGEPRFDTVVDSALFHVFGEADRRRYADVLHRVCLPGAVVHVLALAESPEPGFGPRISEAAIRDGFADGWTVESLESSRYRAVAEGEAAAELGVADGAKVDLPAWLARLRRA